MLNLQALLESAKSSGGGIAPSGNKTSVVLQQLLAQKAAEDARPAPRNLIAEGIAQGANNFSQTYAAGLASNRADERLKTQLDAAKDLQTSAQTFQGGENALNRDQAAAFKAGDWMTSDLDRASKSASDLLRSQTEKEIAAAGQTGANERNAADIAGQDRRQGRQITSVEGMSDADRKAVTQRHLESLSSAERVAFAQMDEMGKTRELNAVLDREHQGVTKRGQDLSAEGQKASLIQRRYETDRQAALDNHRLDLEEVRTISDLNERKKATDLKERDFKLKSDAMSLDYAMHLYDLNSKKLADANYSPAEKAKIQRVNDQLIGTSRLTEIENIKAHTEAIKQETAGWTPEERQALAIGTPEAITAIKDPKIRQEAMGILDFKERSNSRAAKIEEESLGIIDRALKNPKLLEEDPVSIAAAAKDRKLPKELQYVADTAVQNVTKQARATSETFSGEDFETYRKTISSLPLANLTDAQRSSIENKMTEKFLNYGPKMVPKDQEESDTFYQRIDDINRFKLSQGKDPVQPIYSSYFGGVGTADRDRKKITGFEPVSKEDYSGVRKP